MYYCGAMIGLNTSAFIEAAIVGRPVHTIVAPSLPNGREGTVHFHYLKSVGGGVFRLAQNFDEHRAQLATSLREPIPENLHAGSSRFRPPLRSRQGCHGRFRGDSRSRPLANGARSSAPVGAGAAAVAPSARACGTRGRSADWRTRTIEPFSSCSERAVNDHRRQRDAGGAPWTVRLHIGRRSSGKKPR